MEFGNRLRDLRKAKGWTLEELEDKVELSGPYLSKIERGRAIPSEEAVELIAEKLGIEDEEREALLEERDRLALSEQLGIDRTAAEVVVALSRLDEEARTALARVSIALEELEPAVRDELIADIRRSLESVSRDMVERVPAAESPQK